MDGQYLTGIPPTTLVARTLRQSWRDVDPAATAPVAPVDRYELLRWSDSEGTLRNRWVHENVARDIRARWS